MSKLEAVALNRVEVAPVELAQKEHKNGSNIAGEGVNKSDNGKTDKLILHGEIQGEEQKSEETMIEEALETANKAAKAFNRRLDFSVHESTGREIIRVVDTDSNEIIREIPSKKLLDAIGKLQDLMGLIVDQRI